MDDAQILPTNLTPASGNLQDQIIGNLKLNGLSESRVGLTGHHGHDINDGQIPCSGSSVARVVISLAPQEYTQHFVTSSSSKVARQATRKRTNLAFKRLRLKYHSS